MEISMRRPRPVRARSYSAARIELYAYIPAAMSAIEMPAFTTSSGVPVTDSSPASDCTRRS
jgi:hypothetical protein